jgi:hypothetical protein
MMEVFELRVVGCLTTACGLIEAIDAACKSRSECYHVPDPLSVKSYIYSCHNRGDRCACPNQQRCHAREGVIGLRSREIYGDWAEAEGACPNIPPLSLGGEVEGLDFRCQS